LTPDVAEYHLPMSGWKSSQKLEKINGGNVHRALKN